MRKHLLLTALLLAAIPMTGTFAVTAAPAPQSQSQTVTIQGTVMDENNDPVIGASVVAKGASGMAVATDQFGNFKIAAAPGSNLEISYVGYKTVTVKATDGMRVYLEPTTEMLDELVAIGYGSQKRANLTGAVATVDVSRVMDSRPVQDVTRALQGAVPGLTITTSNGDIASNPAIKIRGTGTLSNKQDSNPLIVVDGVPVDDLSFINPEDISEISVLKDAASSAVYGSRAAFGVILIKTKNPSTKNRVSISYNNNFAWSHSTILPEFANNVDQMKYAMMPWVRGNGDREIFGLYFDQLLPYMEKWQQQHSEPYTDYRKLQPYVDENNVGDYRVLEDGTWLRYGEWNVGKTMLRTAPSQKHNVSIEGTSGNTQYRLSFGYDSREGLMKYNPDKLRRYMANASISSQLYSFLKVGARFNFSDRESKAPGSLRNTYQYMWRWPSFFEMYGYMTDYSKYPEGKDIPTRSALSYRLAGGENKTVTTQTRMQGWMDATIIPGLDLYADFTYTLRNMNSDDNRVQYDMWQTWSAKGPSLYSPYSQADTYAAQSNYRDTMWSANIYATYNKTFAQDYSLKVMLGWTAEQEEYKYFYGRRSGIVDDALPNINLTDGTQYQTSGKNWKRATTGFFGRVNLDYKGKYLLELNGRYDASSRFPADGQWAFFPSASVGYRFSEEGYFKPLKSWWSNGKIRASIGQIGNESVGEYMFLPVVSQISAGSVHWIQDGQKITQYNMPRLVSNSLSWERVETADIGIDLGFFDNSLTFGFDWYQRTTKDMLGPSQVLPAVLGADTPYSNNGELRTRGWELSLGWNHSFGDADVYVTATLADARTKITKWNNPSNLLYSYDPSSSNYTEGAYFGDIWGFETERYFEESDFNGPIINDKGKQVGWQYREGVASQTALETNSFFYGPGDVKFKDLNNDGKIDGGKGTMDDHGDLKVIGNALPRYEYGFRIGGAWKGFDIDMFFQGVGKRNLWTTGSLVTPMAQSNLGVFSHQLDCNTILEGADGTLQYIVDQNNSYPNMYAGGGGTGTISNIGRGMYNYYPQSRYLLNMAYLRFKNLTIGYTLPVELTRKIFIQRARVYFSAENLCFLYNGAGKYHLDAEIAQGYDNDLRPGVNDGYAGFGRTTPMPRTLSFGLQVTF